MAVGVSELSVNDASALVDILYLNATLAEEPVLESCYRLMLIHTQCRIEVKEVVGAYEIESLKQGNGSCHVSTAAGDVTVLTLQILTMYVKRI